MNMYNTKTISCVFCGKHIGEIDTDAVVTMPICGQCVNPVVDESMINTICRMTSPLQNKEMSRPHI